MIARDPEGASRDRYDLIIIGGGIHGAMLLLEAGQRGLRSLLVERGDFGGETSFQSLRIVHGGLRYLQALDLPRFFESVRERRWFLRTFPELVTPLPCLMPLYGEGLRRRGVLGAALCANDLLSLHRNRGVGLDRRLPAGRLISAAEVRSRFPDVDGSGLQGAALWYDAHMPDSQRLLMETLRWACALGGRALNYVEAQELCAAGRGVSGISAIDTETGLDHRYHASVVVNATGPWGRGLAARFDRDAPELFRPSLAWNVWFARPAPSDCALALTARDKKAARTYFLHPWKGRLLAGTGHGPWRGEVEQPRPSEAQLDEFIADLNAAVPGWSLRRAEVVRVFAGLLPARERGRRDPGRSSCDPRPWCAGWAGGFVQRLGGQVHDLSSVRGEDARVHRPSLSAQEQRQTKAAFPCTGATGPAGRLAARGRRVAGRPERKTPAKRLVEAHRRGVGAAPR